MDTLAKRLCGFIYSNEVSINSGLNSINKENNSSLALKEGLSSKSDEDLLKMMGIARNLLKERGWSEEDISERIYLENIRL